MSTAPTENSSPKPSAEAIEPVLRPPQFTLRFLFLLTAVVATGTAVTLAFGLDALPALIGMSVTAANAGGMLLFLQQHQQTRGAIVTAAWGFFLISLALPSVHVFGDVRGWEAAWFVLCIEGSIFGYFLGLGGESPDIDKPAAALLLYTPLNVANLILVLAPLILWLYRYRWSSKITQTAAVSASVAWILYAIGDDPGPLIGYYVWCASFLIFISAQRITWRTWWGMVAAMGVITSLKYIGYWF